MILGKVIGTVICTRKNSNLVGNKFLIVEPLEKMQHREASKIVAIDNVGAGTGDIVLIALGSAARVGCDMREAPVDAAIVGIVDDEKDIVLAK
ncbi:ethanolamine utilization protein EutN [Natronincola peptidivorans]|uniref:Ethanolamine utilization protein EutN n=1 Tax=Natronincola peptidivorans TaxID=426128 RepID=A0A1I0CF41_9FIRM|nr:EutN/CcmL family microcompartment protein [Natronincola peptidivorans]SET18215.1 ethanolamine utilization protein EutN [Natronincola peptidivorans]